MAATPASDIFANKKSKIRYEAYSRLQATAVAFGESLPIPEIVAVGGQSDGKSSLLEAFLGFRFNICSSEMGTRRPLFVCMVHDPEAKTPRCRLQEEDSDEYGPVLPENSISEAIRERTETHLRRLGATVSNKPIVMRAEYAYCPNLTIIDTPGFILKARKGEAESTPDDILAMVKEQCAPSNRLILFLQQSSVEWCSSLWMHVIQELDPQFQRTIMVASKFDNRMKEFTERWEVDKYLSASGYLPPNVKPFYVSLPKDRNSTGSSADWRRAIQDVDANIKQHLRNNIDGGFDEERFSARIGFGNLRRFLEDELAARYRDAAPATLNLLHDRVTAAAKELAAAEERLNKAGDVAALRRAAIDHVLAVANLADQVLCGLPSADASRHGLTTVQEREVSGLGQWPGVVETVKPPNAAMKLFGGAAFERCLSEFQIAAAAATFPPVPKERVANMLLAHRSRGSAASAVSKAAEQLARSAARESLSPLLDAACSRLSSVILRAMDVALELGQLRKSTGSEAVRAYVAFHAAVRGALQRFGQRLEERGRELMRRQLEAATGEFAVAALMAEGGMDMEVSNDFLLDNEEEDENDDDEGNNTTNLGGAEIPPTTVRQPFAPTQMTVPETPSPDVIAAKQKEMPLHRQVHLMNEGRAAKTARVGGATNAPAAAHKASAGGYMEVCARAQKLFTGIRESVVGRTAPAILKAAFLEPIHNDLATELSVEILGKTDNDFMNLFAAATTVQALESEKEALARRVEGLTRMRDEFSDIASVI